MNKFVNQTMPQIAQKNQLASTSYRAAGSNQSLMSEPRETESVKWEPGKTEANKVENSSHGKFQADAASASSQSPNNKTVCWMSAKQYPYQPDHQAELLHLQAEADALIVKLQAAGQKQTAEGTMA